MTSNWRSGFDHEAEAIRFWDLLTSEIRRTLGPIDDLDRDDGTITLADRSVVFVDNPACDISDVAPEQWPSYIAWWVGQLAENRTTTAVSTLSRWSVAEPVLRARIVAADRTSDLVERPLSRSLRWGLALAIPGGSVRVTAELMSAWGCSGDTAWAIALANTRQKEPPERSDVVAMERHLRLLEGDLFTTGSLVDLGDLVPEIGSDGALVVAPSSHAVLVQPIDGWVDVAEDAARLLVAALQYQDASSHPLPPAVLWYRGPGSLTAAVELSDRPAPRGMPFRLDIVADEPLRSALDAA